ncbi:MAG: hypothetical protein AMXMBFR64_48010 [Myxococcales bacterium]
MTARAGVAAGPAWVLWLALCTTLVLARPGAAQTDAWDCQGTTMPPTADYDYEVAHAPAGPGQEQVAQDAATASLVRRHCAQGRDCEGLRELIRPWRVGRGPATVCAMVAARTADLERWRSRFDADALTRELARSLAALVQREGGTLDAARVAIDKVKVGAVAGGELASFFQRMMSDAVTRAGGRVVVVARGWNGRSLPKDTDVVARGLTQARRHEGVAGFDLAWEIRSRTDGAWVVSPPVFIPGSIAPGAPPDEASPPPVAAALTLRIGARSGGGLCDGERTDAWLTADQDLHVRVFDLYGPGGLLVFPAGSGQGPVRAAQTLALGPLDAVQLPGSPEELFLVVAAPTRAALGWMAPLDQPCRLRPADVAALRSGAAIPKGALVAHDGYRIVADPTCPPPLDAATRAAAMAAVEGLPLCR